MRPLAVAWDIDGTLLDSEPVHLLALLTVSARHGVDLSNDPEDRFVGQHLGDVWKILSPGYPAGLSEQDWVAQILAEYALQSHRLVAVEPMLQTMLHVHALGIPQVCVSNSERPIVDTNIAVLEIAGMIDFSISRDDVAAGKPDPEPYREACRRLGLEPGRVLAVEDSDTGAASARAAGLEVVRITLETAEETMRAILARFESG
jgi:HAD superfamily hydrolase (TIGR01509 family)